MYTQGQKIIVRDGAALDHCEVLAVRGSSVYYVTQDDPTPCRVDLINTYPPPPAGREVEAEWRVPVKGDTVYDDGGWVVIDADWSVRVFGDPLNVGWRRLVLKPLPAAKMDLVKGLEVAYNGKALVRYTDGSQSDLEFCKSISDLSLARSSHSPADIALIRKGLPKDVQRYLDSKPADAENEMRVPGADEEYYSWPIDNGYQCWHTVTVVGEPGERSPLMGRRRWIRKAAPAVTELDTIRAELAARRAEDAQHRMTAENCETLRQENAKLRAQVERLKAIIGTIKESLQ